MAVRNYKQLSSFLQEILTRLSVDQELCKLVKYNDLDPLSHIDLTTAQRKALITTDKLLRFIPKIGPLETSSNIIAVVIPGGEKSKENKEIIQMNFEVCIYVPIANWIIKGDDLRIFLIMSKVEELLDGKDIGGIGKFYSRDFELMLTTDELVGYRVGFDLDAFS